MRGTGLTNRDRARIWRNYARALVLKGRMAESIQARRTAALIEGRPWRADRIVQERCPLPAPPHSQITRLGWR